MSDSADDGLAAFEPVAHAVNQRRANSKKSGRIGRASDLPPDDEILQVGIPWLASITGGGIVMGKVVLAYGEEQCGKTDDALRACKQVIDDGGTAVIYPTEPLSLAHIKAVGIKPHDLLIVVADNGDDALETITDYLEDCFKERGRGPELVVIDSVTAMRSRKEATTHRAANGAITRGFNAWLRLLEDDLPKYKTCLWVISQLRTIPRGDDAENVYTGGRMLVHAAWLKVRYRKVCEIFDPKTVDAADPEPIGRVVGIVVEKLKGVRMRSSTRFTLTYNRDESVAQVSAGDEQSEADGPAQPDERLNGHHRGQPVSV